MKSIKLQSKVGVKDPLYEYVLVYTQPVVVVTVHVYVPEELTLIAWVVSPFDHK